MLKKTVAFKDDAELFQMYNMNGELELDVDHWGDKDDAQKYF